ncbi:MAG: c-type cytochrome [Caulobacteraceae bacterium]
MLKPVAAAALAAWMIAAATPALAAGDPAHGKSLFQDRCGVCHQGAADDGDGGQGPDLWGVVGRKAGAAADFAYTPAMKGANLTWTPETLDKFLTSPGKVIPGTAMPVSTANPQDRADLIAYLATLKGKR